MPHIRQRVHGAAAGVLAVSTLMISCVDIFAQPPELGPIPANPVSDARTMDAESADTGGALDAELVSVDAAIVDSAPADGGHDLGPADASPADSCPDGAPEICDGEDNDCDDQIDEGVEGCEVGCDHIDSDGDGRSDEGCDETVCGSPQGQAVPPCNGCSAGTVVPHGWVCVPAGIFTMGSPVEEFGSNDGERPQLQVEISRPFLIQATELTQTEWSRYSRGSNPAYFSLEEGRPCDVDQADRCPVERVNWFDAIWYANERSRAEGLPTCYDEGLLAQGTGQPGTGCRDDDLCAEADERGKVCNEHCEATYLCNEDRLDPLDLNCRGYRLPTEAEWEYAARAGTVSAFAFGDDEARISEMGWCNDWRLPRPVMGDRAPNAWGIYDMHGNLWEWVHDDHANYADDWPGPVRDRLQGSPAPAVSHVLRGGSFLKFPGECRSASRFVSYPVIRYWDAGFRLVRRAAP